MAIPEKLQAVRVRNNSRHRSRRESEDVLVIAVRLGLPPQMNDLREITKYPSFLEKAGFVEREEDTSDVVRWVWFEKAIDSVESEVRLVVQVEFELSILDNPFVRTSDNFSYSFNGVYLKIIERPIETGDSQSDDEASFLKNPHIPPVEAFMEEEPREIDRFPLNVTTLAQLRSLCRMLGCND